MIKKVILKANYLLQKNKNKNTTKEIINKIINEDEAKRIFLFQTPTHSNIGDHAIAEAQLSFLQQNFDDYTVYEINDDIFDFFIEKIDLVIKNSDIILLHGGGNFGNEYIILEKARRLIISKLQNNKIVVFPQTIHYSNDSLGENELKITQEIFSQHKNLTLTAREEVSYELMKKYFPNNNVILTPDIVLYTSQLKSKQRTYGLKVIREDQESILSEKDKSYITDLLKSTFSEVIASDMHVKNFRSVRTTEDRELILKNKFEQFQQAKIVITDRLHGMVFATISGTPCIVFSNYNQKVLGTYSWIKDLDYIRFVNNIDEAKIAFKELTELTNYKLYENSNLKSKYQPLIKAISE
ncbi:polysaccharide pyruvyl transferase family protein [Chishuiella sp.]|uniref:polysaccharide pyruvyl transferase family protein n=1 Tax=Chishuiella sp. TaxID=1969467 RepID=UPI0028AD58DA|nr:polysaccharide pyruvyl transferase family protein [Chishuiella sp.]